MENNPPYRISLRSLEQTSSLARAVAAALRGGEVIALEGDLGAGKTSFTRELTRALGCQKLANSPTFALFQRYRGGRFAVLHGDFYRLGHEDELVDLGWHEMLDEMEAGLVVVEWANRFPELLPSDRLHMVWTLGGQEEEREVSIIAGGPRARHVLQQIGGETLTL